MSTSTFDLKGESFIELNKLMQLLSLVNSGGEAKMFILNGEVLVNEIPENSIRKKLRSGDSISFMNQKIDILDSKENEMISILMPTKNAEKWLEACLDSILSQSETKWELISVNDNSTDSSESILKKYAGNDERIITLNNEGDGIIDALSLAFSKSSGSYITRMDADDTMHPDKLKHLKTDLTKAGRGHLALGQVKYISEKAIGEGYAAYEAWLNSIIAEGKNWDDLYKECVIPSPCWMVHRSDLDKAGAFHSKTYPEDYDLTFRFYAAGLIPIPSSNVLHNWRDYPERTSRTSEVYADNKFTELKSTWFMRLHADKNRPLVLWGAGKRGKAIAAELLFHDLEFHWLTNNPNKIGHNIYGIILGDEKDLRALEKPQVIVALANKANQALARGVFDELGLKTIEDLYFFC